MQCWLRTNYTNPISKPILSATTLLGFFKQQMALSVEFSDLRWRSRPASGLRHVQTKAPPVIGVNGILPQHSTREPRKLIRFSSRVNFISGCNSPHRFDAILHVKRLRLIIPGSRNGKTADPKSGRQLAELSLFQKPHQEMWWKEIWHCELKRT